MPPSSPPVPVPDRVAIEYRRRATPALEIVVGIHAARVARGAETVAVAVAASERIARDLGADQLTPAWRRGLSDWIAEALSRKAAVARAKRVENPRW